MEGTLSSQMGEVGAEGRVRAAREGDHDAFAALVRPCLRQALSAATLIAGSPSDGADAVQEALLSAWKALPGLRDPAAFPAWFRRLVVRSAVRVATRRRRVPIVELDLAAALGSDDLDREYQLRLVGRAFDRLDPKDRLILSLRFGADLAVEDVASALAIPLGTAKSRLHAATARLRAACEAEERR